MSSIFAGIMIPFIGTTAGAACVFFLKNALKPSVQKAFLGFASGVMVAASVWSLLIPSMDMSGHMGKLAFIPASVGFLLGIGFLLLLDEIIPHLHIDTEKTEGPKSDWKKSTMLVLAEFLGPVLPYFLSFAAGAMIYVVVEELIPESAEGEHSNVATIGFAVGFVVMMILDVALG